MTPDRPSDPGEVREDQPASGRAETPDSARLIDSETLLCGAREALIAHHGVTYRLRATRAGKLILTK